MTLNELFIWLLQKTVGASLHIEHTTNHDIHIRIIADDDKRESRYTGARIYSGTKAKYEIVPSGEQLITDLVQEVNDNMKANNG